jgi:hypothetical protein
MYNYGFVDPYMHATCDGLQEYVGYQKIAVHGVTERHNDSDAAESKELQCIY